jgi:hypothetical protein
LGPTTPHHICWKKRRSQSTFDLLIQLLTLQTTFFNASTLLEYINIITPRCSSIVGSLFEEPAKQKKIELHQHRTGTKQKLYE